MSRLLRVGLAAWYVVLSLGFSLPISVASGSYGGVPYPCQGHRCGCLSAEQCWRSCCCMNDAAKLLWARKNGVSPPAWFLALRAEQDEVQSAPPLKPCCQKLHDRRQLASAERSCCRTNPADAWDEAAGDEHACRQKSTGARKSSSSTERGVMLISALRCRGIETLWSMAAPTCLAEVGQEWSLSLTDTRSTLLVRNDLDVPAPRFSPPVPPPRLVV